MSDITIEESKVRELYDEFSSLYKESLLAKEEVKEAKKKIREELAMKKGYYKKDGVTPDVAKINARALFAAFDVSLGGRDKIAELYEMEQEFLAEIRNGEIQHSVIESMSAKESAAKAAGDSFKEAVAEQQSLVDPDIVKAIAKLAKENVDEEAKEEAGATPKKDVDLSLIRKLRAIVLGRDDG